MESVGSLDGMAFQCVKELDTTTADLISVFEKKIKIPSAKLCLLSIVDGKETTMTYLMHDVIVTSHAQEGNSETYTFNYGKIEQK